MNLLGPISPLPTPTLIPDLQPAGDTNIVTGFIVVIAVNLLFIGGFYLYNWLRAIKQGYPLEKQIEDALLPYLHGIIAGAFEESQQELSKIEDAIDNADKAELAAKLYDLLPETIAGYDIAFLQSIFTVEQFTEIFLRAYHSAKEYYVDHKGRFTELFDAWNTGK